MNLAPLADVADIFMGQSPPGSTYNTDGNGLPFFQGKTDFGDIYPTVRMYCTEPKRIAEVNDILISVRAPVGPTNLAPIKSAIGRGLAAIRCKEGTDVKYLLYFLRHNESKLAQLGTGSTFEAIGRDDLEDVGVPLPPLPEQRRIAALLDKADHLRRTRRYAAQLSDTFLQAVFVRMFGDLEHLPQETMNQVCSEIFECKHYTPEYVIDGIPLIRTNDIVPGFFKFGTTKYVSLDDYNKLTDVNKPKCNDIVFAREGSFGVASIIQSNRPYAIGQRTMSLRADTVIIDPIYLTAFINSSACQRELAMISMGTTVGRVNVADVKELRVPIAPLSLQKQFVHTAQQFERLRAEQREAERQAELLFQTLLHHTFRGEV